MASSRVAKKARSSSTSARASRPEYVDKIKRLIGDISVISEALNHYSGRLDDALGIDEGSTDLCMFPRLLSEKIDSLVEGLYAATAEAFDGKNANTAERKDGGAAHG